MSAGSIGDAQSRFGNSPLSNSLWRPAELAGRRGAVNIELDKAGGLAEAPALAAETRAAGLRIMVGCMVATSLAMAPALLLARDADRVDRDGPLLPAPDDRPGLVYEGTLVHPASPEPWGAVVHAAAPMTVCRWFATVRATSLVSSTKRLILGAKPHRRAAF